MAKDELTGRMIPRFFYDTPALHRQDFYDLCDDDRPLALLFLANFGHPITQEYLAAYADTLPALRSGRLACVVRSDADRVARSVEDAVLPFPLLCDPEGVLYQHFGVRTVTGKLGWSIRTFQLIGAAKRQGYEPAPEQLLPLTLLVGRNGLMLFAHQGVSPTDLPDDCEAIEAMCSAYLRQSGGASDEVGDLPLSPPDAD